MQGRNEKCYCGSGKKYKKCCLGKKNKNFLLNSVEQNILDLMQVQKKQSVQEYFPTKHNGDKGIRSFVLATLDNIRYDLNNNRELSKQTIFDLVRLGDFKNKESEYIKINFEVMKEQEGYFVTRKGLELSLKTEPTINRNEAQLIRDFGITLLNHMEESEEDFIPFDTELMRMEAELIYRAIISEEILDYNYLTFVKFHVEVEDGRECLKEYIFTYSEQESHLIFFFMKHEEDLFNKIKSIKQELPFLENKTAKLLGTLKHQLASLTNTSVEFMSYDSIYLGLFTCVEYEIRSLLMNSNIETKSSTMLQSIDKLIQYKEFMDIDIEKLHEIRVKRNKIQHDEIEANMEEIQDIKNYLINRFFPTINHVKMNLSIFN